MSLDACETLTYTVKKLLVRHFSDRVGDRTVVDYCNFIPMSVGDVPIHAVEACIQVSSREPASERRAAIIKHLIVHLIPRNHLTDLSPKLLRLFNRPLIIVVHVIISKRNKLLSFESFSAHISTYSECFWMKSFWQSFFG